MTSAEPANETPSKDVALAGALDALSHPSRIALLRQLRTPKAINEIRLSAADASAEDPEGRSISRQAIHKHLERLTDIGAVIVRGARGKGMPLEYVVNHQALFAIAEEFRELATLRPVLEMASPTVTAAGQPLPAEPSVPTLVLVKGIEEGRMFALEPAKETWIIGRRRDADISLDFDPFVSGHNTRIDRQKGTFTVRALEDSLNGTLVNFMPIAKGVDRPLIPGDIIGVGRSILTFQLPHAVDERSASGRRGEA
ncbi:MAG: FHA domain-containing protein [Thermoplasmatota archaeon]